MRSLTDQGSALATYGDLSYLVSLLYELDELSPMQVEFTYDSRGMYYLCTLLFIINKWKDILQYSSLLHVIQSLYLLCILLVHVCNNNPIERSTSRDSLLHQESISTCYQR